MVKCPNCGTEMKPESASWYIEKQHFNGVELTVRREWKCKVCDVTLGQRSKKVVTLE